MVDHDELVGEMPILETMGTQERQKLAKKRRLQQLKRWAQREKEWIAKEKQLNKRLANIMSEENNGLNLKQYTSYNSNQRTKKRLVNIDNNNVTSNNNGNINSNSDRTADHAANCKSKEFNNNNNNINNNPITGPYSNWLNPNGRVHFNVGIMLLEAATRNDYDEVKRLLSLGVSPDSVNHDGLTALHQCCIDASEPIMQLLLDYGANVDARDTEQWTPLHAACTCGHLNLVKILVEHQADLLAVNGDGNMPFDICEDEATLDYIESQMVKQGITQEMIDLTRASNEMTMLNDLEKLVSQKGNLNESDAQGVTRLHIAATNNYLSAVKLMLNHGVDVNVCDNDLWQPLHGVACWGNEQHIKIVELLVEAGANLDAKTLNDETVFDLCDNVELLNRLNQIKDELESKQATGTGRLRRTQSRTNSRVHSVRRTSVRDKNQISRREAREEALLRVDSVTDKTINNIDSATALHSTDDTKNSSDATDQNGTAPKVTNLDESDVSSVNQTKDEQECTHQGQKQPQHTASRSQIECDDETDEAQSPSNGIIEPQRQDTSDHSMASHDKLPLERVPPVDEVAAQPTSRLTKTNQENNMTAMDANLSSNKRSVDVSERQTNGIPKQNGHIEKPDLQAAVQAQHQTRQQINNHLQQTQFAPINYTLSNLKKLRSDMRMRSCSINGLSLSSADLGGNPDGVDAFDGANRLAPSASNLDAKVPVSAREPVLFEPEPTMVASSPTKLVESATHRFNGIHPSSNSNNSTSGPPSSPSLTFRKYHGQAGETFGDGSSRKVRHKCCIVM